MPTVENSQLCVLKSLEPFPIDIVEIIVLKGTLLVLILLQAVEMAAKFISCPLGPWGGRIICK